MDSRKRSDINSKIAKFVFRVINETETIPHAHTVKVQTICSCSEFYVTRRAGPEVSSLLMNFHHSITTEFRQGKV